MSTTTILVSTDGPICTLTVNRPQVLNALNATVWAELHQALDAVENNPEIRVVVLTGAGEKAFVAGADIQAMVDISPAEAELMTLRSVKPFHDRLRTLTRPVIASINGFCLGGGLELALACDIRIAADNARFGFPEIKLGILPGGGGTARLHRHVGVGLARALTMTGDMIGAEEARAAGLVYRVVPGAALKDETQKLATQLAGYSPVALRQLKQVLEMVQNCDLDTAQAVEAKGFGLCFASADQREGMRAFLDKRAPNFTGR